MPVVFLFLMFGDRFGRLASKLTEMFLVNFGQTSQLEVSSFLDPEVQNLSDSIGILKRLQNLFIQKLAERELHHDVTQIISESVEASLIPTIHIE